MRQGQFQMRVADILFQVENAGKNTLDRCRPFIPGEQGIPKYTVAITDEDIALEKEYIISGIGPEALGYMDPEFMSLQRHVTSCLCNENVLLIHASAVLMEGEAYLFTAVSGTGKTTHSTLWHQVFGDRMSWLTDDKPFVRIQRDGVTIFGSPWMGKERRGSNISAPLAGIACLKRGEVNRPVPMTSTEKWNFMAEQTHLVRTQEGMTKTLSLLQTLIDESPILRMECNMDPEAAAVCYQALKDDREAWIG